MTCHRFLDYAPSVRSLCATASLLVVFTVEAEPGEQDHVGAHDAAVPMVLAARTSDKSDQGMPQTPRSGDASAAIAKDPPSPLTIPEKEPSGKRTLIPVNERQGKAIIYEEILNGSAGKPSGIVISLSRQRAYLLLGGELAIDSPIASGRKEGWTPKGAFTVLEKDLNHRSNRYGDLVDEGGKVIRKNVTCGAAGGTFRGASMKYFLRLTYEGVGMHAGILPGYPASHGCIRLPGQVAERMFKIVPAGTPVLVLQ